jgi:hypothetical protein
MGGTHFYAPFLYLIEKILNLLVFCSPFAMRSYLYEVGKWRE